MLRVVFLQVCQEVVQDLLMVSWVPSKLLLNDCVHSASCERLLQARPREKLLLQAILHLPKTNNSKGGCVAVCRRRSKDFRPFYKAGI